MKLSKQANAAILLRVARKTIDEARRAWRRVGEGERSLRSAFRACVLAARSARRAAEAWASINARVTRQLLDDAKNIEAAATDLKAKLAAAVVGTDPALPGK